METARILILCTTHLPQAVMESLVNEPDSYPFTVAPCETGAFVSTYGATADAVASDLGMVRYFARANGFQFIQFDRDVETIPELPDHDWND